MTKEWINILLLAALFLSLFGIAEMVYYLLKIKAEWTRRFVHLGTGLLALLFPVMIGNHWLVLVLCFSFFILLVISLKYNFLKSINNVSRNSVGSLAFPAAVYGCYLAYCFVNRQYLFYYLPLLILAVCDPLAAAVGKHFSKKKYQIQKTSKTYVGSAVFFVSAFIISFTFLTGTADILTAISLSFLIGFSATIAEAFAKNGWDNITIPASVLMCLFTLEYFKIVQ
jgi:dolichol kinase